MNRRMTAWIPIAIMLVPALILFFFTLWMGAAEYSPEIRDFTGPVRLGGFFDRLTETVFLTDLLHSLLLRLLSLAAGCGLGFAAGAVLRRIPSAAVRGLAVSLFGVLAFLPPQFLMTCPPLNRISSDLIRCGGAIMLPVFSLSLFCAAAFPAEMKKTAALLPLAFGAVFVLTVDIDAALAAPGAMTLDTRAVSLIRSGFYTPSAQVSSLKILAECLLALIPAAVLARVKTGDHVLRGSAAGAAACAALALAVSSAFLLPAVLSSPDFFSAFSGPAFSAGLTAAALAFVTALAVSAAILMSRLRGMAMMAALFWALVILSAFSAAKCALAEQASVSPAVVAGLLAAFSPQTLSLMLCLAVLSPGRMLNAVRGALACACLAAARGYFSTLPDILGMSAPGGLMAVGDTQSLALLAFPLIMYIPAACLLSVFIWPAKKKKNESEKEHVYLSQGWSSSGRTGASSALPAASLHRDSAPQVKSAAVPAPVIQPAVPATSDYTRQFVLSQEPHDVPLPSPTLAVEEMPRPEESPATAGTAESVSYAPPVRQDPPFDGVIAPQQREEEIPEGAPPSPAQIVSMINSLTRMRSLGIMSEEDYREKYDRLMKML